MSEDVTPEATHDAAPEAPQGTPWYEKEIKELRAEAAKYRVQKNEAVTAAREATVQEYDRKLAEERSRVDEMKQATGLAELETEKYKAAVRAGIPTNAIDEVVSLAQGTDADSIASSVDKLKSIMGNAAKEPAVDPTQGTGAVKPLPLNGDPVMQALIKAATPGIRM